MSREQCPVAKWIIRRTPANEKYLVVYKQRPGHICQYAVTVAAILCYEAVNRSLADLTYNSVCAVMRQEKGKVRAV